jgi:hypothetical protein
MRQLLYASNTHRDVSGDFLNEILAISRKNNAEVGVTGVLLYIDGGFMQVLEGEDEAVSETYARICQDKRHWNTSVLLDRDAPRAFAEWSMGFTRPTDLSDGMFTVTQEAIDGKLKPGAPAEIMVMLRTFYRMQSGEQAA